MSVPATIGDYGVYRALAGVARTTTGAPLIGPQVRTPWDLDLSPAMQDAGVAVHEELLLPGLLHDW